MISNILLKSRVSLLQAAGPFLWSPLAFRAFSTNPQMRIYSDKVNLRYPANFAQDILAGPQHVRLQRRKMPVRVDKAPIPLHDFINFKTTASGNEILLNLDNCDNLRNGELVSALIELARRDTR